MTRLFAILLLVMAGLPGMGFGIGQQLRDGQPCEDAACHQIVLETSCCGETVAVEYCPMSEGPCECVASVPERQPRPTAPHSRTDRDQLIAVPSAPVRVVTLADPVAKPSLTSPRAFSLLAGLTHNQIQASLGLWTT